MLKSATKKIVTEIIINGKKDNWKWTRWCLLYLLVNLVTPEHRTNYLHASSTNDAGITDWLFLTQTTDHEVISTVINLKNARSKDINSLQMKPIKYTIDILAPVLVTRIFKLAMSTGLFPEQIQIFRVTLIHKGVTKIIWLTIGLSHQYFLKHWKRFCIHAL